MALERTEAVGESPTPAADQFQGRHLAIGANVLFSVVVATAIAGILQWGGYRKHAKIDLTDSSVNSLAPWTEQLFGGLEQKIRLTSMYFETDIEDEDQAKYRTKVNDLVALYQSVNPSKVEVDRFNPLQDHAKREAFLLRVRNLPKFAEQVGPYRELVERFQGEIAGAIGTLIQSELDAVTGLIEAASVDRERDALGQIQELLTRWKREIELAARDLEEAVSGSQPRYGAAKTILSGLTSGLPRDLNSIVSFSAQHVERNPELSEVVATYFSGAGERYQPVIDVVEDLSETVGALPQLDIENLLRQIAPTSNALVIETENDAKILGFGDVWPTADPNIPAGSARFADRLFKGEAAITTAAIQLTVTEKTAVTFVRFAGPPLFTGFPGSQQAPPYMQIKERLEEANFAVNEWDLATADGPPEVDPSPVRTIYIVLRPSPPPQMPMGQQQQPQFSEEHKQRILAALGENARALFLAGWMPGPFGAFPDPYPFDGYLNDTWGIHVASDLLLQRVYMGQKPGEFSIAQQSWVMQEMSRSDQVIVKDIRGRPSAFPFVSPLEIAADLPEGVNAEPLLWCERSEDLWGIKNVQTYVEKARAGRGVTMEAGDVLGPFNFAAAAEKGDGKIVVISSRSCMIDAFAMAQGLAITAEGFTYKDRNPGNLHLLLNALYWLNDKTEWMNVGTPVDLGTIEIDPGTELTIVRAFVFAVWPAMAACCGGVAWWIRRR